MPSILRRTAHLALAPFLIIASAACGADDDGSGPLDGGSGPPDGGDVQPDAGDAPPDARGSEPDAGGVDAAPVEGPRFLLGFDLTVSQDMEINGVLRIIATFERSTVRPVADFALQPLHAPECNPAMSGVPVGDPIVRTGIEIRDDNTFQIPLENVVLLAGSFGNPLLCDTSLIVNLTIDGQLQPTGELCGQLAGEIISPSGALVTGTFGGVAIEAGIIGDDLPPAVMTCPPP
jgi:hypothetical protein